MKRLIENLYNNNVVFSYYGFMDESVVNQILEITTSKLISNNESQLVIQRVVRAIRECGHNIIAHNFYPEDARVKYKSLIVISKKENSYTIDTINVVNKEQKNSINEQLEFLNNCSPNQLAELKNKNDHSQQALVLVSVGLLDLVLKADYWECKFREKGQDFLFNIKYSISCLN